MKCASIEEVRSQIDRLDKDIVRLIAKREQYVKQAAFFKKNTDEVNAPKRVEQVIEKVRALAQRYEGNPDVVEEIYRTMIKQFIQLEMTEFKK